jgi:hypothetical protein
MKKARLLSNISIMMTQPYKHFTKIANKSIPRSNKLEILCFWNKKYHRKIRSWKLEFRYFMRMASIMIFLRNQRGF